MEHSALEAGTGTVLTAATRSAIRSGLMAAGLGAQVSDLHVYGTYGFPAFPGFGGFSAWQVFEESGRDLDAKHASGL